MWFILSELNDVKKTTKIISVFVVFSSAKKRIIDGIQLLDLVNT